MITVHEELSAKMNSYQILTRLFVKTILDRFVALAVHVNYALGDSNFLHHSIRRPNRWHQ